MVHVFCPNSTKSDFIIVDVPWEKHEVYLMFCKNQLRLCFIYQDNEFIGGEIGGRIELPVDVLNYKYFLL